MELISVLSTKTLDEEWLKFAQSLGLQMQCIDFIKTTGLVIDISSVSKNNYDAVAFTSANAVKHFFGNKNASTLLENKTVFSLSGKTAEELLYYGIQPATVENNAAALADAIINTASVSSVLHICGNLALGTLQNKLSSAGINYVLLEVYQTTFIDQKIDESFDAVLFYSPSGVKSFFTSNKIKEETVCCCIGETTAAELKNYFTGSLLLVPGQPSPELMLRTVGGHFRARGTAR